LFSGYSNKLLSNMIDWPIWWKLNGAETKIRPAHVMDVAQALSSIVTRPKFTGGVYSLPGPSTLTYEYLLELVQSLTYRPASGAPALPKSVALALSKFAQNVWWPALSPDEVERRFLDDVDTPGDWATFGIEPTEIEPVAITYLRRYRGA
jgi:NADH dehydrogenase (ubiquinone) 1 alpha subcomplex subunit 9